MYAKKEATRIYLQRHGWMVKEKDCDFYTSPIGIGNHLGTFEDEDSRRYVEAMIYALEHGINLLDTAINYRGMRSEKDTGEALSEAIRRKIVEREEVVVASKAGLLFGDITNGIRPMDCLEQELAEVGVTIEHFQKYEGLFHTLTPAFHQKALELSLRNLKLDCIDIYYLHMPEISRAALGEEEFYRQLEVLFCCYEDFVAAGKIRNYGIAFEHMIFEPNEEKWNISLERAKRIAKKAGGKQNHFTCIQLPFNRMLTTAAAVENQIVDNQSCTSLDAARKLGLTVAASMPFDMGDQFETKSVEEMLTFDLKEDRISWINCGSKNPHHIEELIAIAQKEEQIMPIQGIEQPQFLPIDEKLRLRKYDDNCAFALDWYQDEETLMLVDGKNQPYDMERLYRMYHYLEQRGEVYFIEIKEAESAFRPIGDVTFWQEDMPIVIGDSSLRGQGIGRKVIRALIERAKELGYPYLLVNEIYDYNEGSRKMFESMGFCADLKTDKGWSYRLELK